MSDPSETAITRKPWQFQPGQPSANPGGRPKGLERRVRELVDFDQIILAMRDIALAQGPNGAGASKRDRIAAAQFLADRGYGKPKFNLEITDGNEPTVAIDVEAMADDDLDDLERLLDGGDGVIDVEATEK